MNSNFGKTSPTCFVDAAGQLASSHAGRPAGQPADYAVPAQSQLAVPASLHFKVSPASRAGSNPFHGSKIKSMLTAILQQLRLVHIAT